MMPGLDAMQTFARMKAEPSLSQTPVVFMTAKAMPQEIARFRAMGDAGVIAKPFDPMLLVTKVFRIWDSIASPAVAHA